MRADTCGETVRDKGTRFTTRRYIFRWGWPIIMGTSYGKLRNFQITIAPIWRIILKIYVWENMRVHKERRKSGCHRSAIKGNLSIMKDTLRAEQGTFLNVSPVPFKGFFRNSTAINHDACSTMGERLVALGQ